jgi:triosephosphate isomerase
MPLFGLPADTMRAGLVAGNWKMHGSLAANQALLVALKAQLGQREGVRYAVCVPYPYLNQVATVLAGSPVSWGAQNLSEHDVGAHTGEVSGAMLKDFGCRYVIVGHSERRGLHGETDQQVAAKFMAAQRVGLTPILCVGETLDQRERGDTEAVVGRQLEAVLNAAGVAGIANAAIAYEPVWAIGTGKTATPAQAQGMHEFIRGLVAKRDKGLAAEASILYGGSVKPGNARELFAMPDVDGGLIGGASLVAADFVAICEAAGAK